MGRKMSVENVVAFACKTAEKKFHHDMNGTDYTLAGLFILRHKGIM